MGTGDVILATPDNEHCDLFFGFPNSYGSLGYALRLEIELEPAAPYIRLRHLRQLNAATASETIAGKYWSGSGGQADFAKGAMLAEGGQGFIVLRSTTTDGATSRIVPRLTRGSVVTTLKNTVDKVVTEWGIAELRGRSLTERADALISAHRTGAGGAGHVVQR